MFMLTPLQARNSACHECDVQKINTDSIEQLLQCGSIDVCCETVTGFFDDIGFCRVDSLLLRLYIAMDIYIIARSFAKNIGVSDEDFLEQFGSIDAIETKFSTTAETVDFFTKMILQCVKWRTELVRENSGDTIKRAKEYIDRQYKQDDISLKSVAAAMNFSPTYFSSLFKKEVGMNFINYLTEVRIHKAKNLLCCTNKMVYEVAYEVGFRDYRYFSQIFKRYTGCTPREFQCSSNKISSYNAELKVEHTISSP